MHDLRSYSLSIRSQVKPNSMNRKDFLASIPMLSAIPLIGTGFIQTKKEIIIQNPKPIEIVKDIDAVMNNHYIDPAKVSLAIMYDGMIVSQTNSFETNEHNAYIEDFQITYLHKTELILTARFVDGGEKLMDAFSTLIQQKYR